MASDMFGRDLERDLGYDLDLLEEENRDEEECEYEDEDGEDDE